MKFNHQTQQVITNNYEVEVQKLGEVMEVGVFETDNEAMELVAVGIRNRRETTGLNASSHESYWSAIMEKWVADKICAKPEDYETILNQEIQHDQTSVYNMLSYETLSNLRQYGRIEQLYKFDGKEIKYASDEEKCDMLELVRTPNHNGHALCRFVRNRQLHHVWQTAAGQYVANPFLLDYIEANLDNGTYHLDELTEHLSHLDNVAFIANERQYSSYDAVLLKAPLKGNEKHINSIIHDIPSYNADDERNESITVVYYPTQEEIEVIMNWQQDKNDKARRNMYNVSRYIVQEILGGKNYLKHPAPEVEQTVTRRKFGR